MAHDPELLAKLLENAPFQPATDYWRSVELAAIPGDAFPEGLGLDLGCGDGRLTGILLERIGKRRLIGLDFDPVEVDAAQREGHHERIHTASADAIPESSATFAFVFSNSVLEHLPMLPAVLDEVARVLQPGGRFIFTVPTDTFHACLAGPTFGDRAAYLVDLDRRCQHVNYWGETRWRSELAARGLDVTQAVPYLNAREVQCWERLTNATAGLASRLVRGTLKPIEIQRRLGMRGHRARMPAFVARLLSQAIPLPASLGSSDTSTHGCMLFVADKRSSD